MPDDLITRLREAKEGSRELDADIAALAALAPPGFRICNSGASYQKYNSATDTVQFWAPHPYTTDLSAAVVLLERVLPGWFWRVGHGSQNPGWANLNRVHPDHCDKADESYAIAATPALALCLAILTAKEHQPPASLAKEPGGATPPKAE